MTRRGAALVALTLAMAAAGCGSKSSSQPTTGAGSPVAVKVLVVNMATIEAEPFVGALGPMRDVPIKGLPASDPNVHCNASGACEVTLGMGYANAASSMTIVLASSALDLAQAYVFIAGIAGIDPAQGTIDTASWARYVVDFGQSQEVDAREMPSGWPYGYFGLGTTSPTQAPPTPNRNLVFQIDENLLQAALSLSKGAQLDDNPQAMLTRSNYPSPANQPPRVVQCDTISTDTYWDGTALNQRARDWMKLVTNGAGTFCMSAEEDNATLEVLTRGAAAGRVDMKRVAVLRSASDFSAPWPGQTDAAGLHGSLNTGAVDTSARNLAHAAMPVIQAIVSNWAAWQGGVPKP